jgi:outer membrane protein assembly factor BamB
MHQTNEQFLSALKGLALLPPEVLETLRDLVAEAKGDVQPRHLAKWLVDNGHLTPFQAKELLAGKMKAGARPSAPVEEELEVVEDEELEVVPDEPIQPPPPAAEEPLEVVDDEELEVLEDDLSSPPKQPPGGPWSKSAKRPAKPAQSRPPAPPAAAASNMAPLDALAGGDGMGMSGSITAPLSGAAAAAPAGYGPRTRLQAGGKGRKKKAGGNVWDSPLLLIVGGSILALAIVGVVLLWRINQGNADEAMRLAEDEYGRAAYSQAIEMYDRYLKNHPDHERVSLARVHRGLARMRQVVDATNDWQRALKVSKEILAEIQEEKEFVQGHGELAAMLPKIANGLKEQARLNPDQDLVDQAREAVGLVQRYVPKAQQPHEQLKDIEDSLALTARALAQDDTLQKALTDIRGAVTAGQPARAYEIRNQLIKTYPGLIENAALQEAVLTASQAERQQVKMDATSRTAETAEAEVPGSGMATIILAPRTGEAAAGVEPGQVAFALAGGAAYALDAATGRVLWRRFVGADTTFVPSAVETGGGDAILVDSIRNEVLRVESATGRLRWRIALDGPLADGPILLRDRLLAAERSGRINAIDLETGSIDSAVLLPQAIRTSPAPDNRGRKCYQLGEHSNLFVLPATGDGCDEVVYLGHEPGGITIAPAVMGRFVIVAENTGVSKGVLKVLATDENGLGARLVQQIPLTGHVKSPFQTAGKNLLVATDKAALYTFEVGAGEQGDPLTKIAEKAASDDKSRMRYLQTRGAQFWLADEQLTMYDVQAAKGQLAPRWVKFPQDSFTQPPLPAGDFLITARRRSGRAGITVAAIRVADGTAAWETQLAAPPAGQPAVAGDGRVSMLTAAGALFQAAAAELATDRTLDQPLAALDVPIALPAATVALHFGGVMAFAADELRDQILVFNPQAGQKLRLVSPPAIPSGRASVLDGKLLVAAATEQILLLDPRNGKAAVEPFLPRQELGSERTWTALAPLADEQALAADSLGNVFLLTVDAKPAPHLSALKETRLESPIASSWAAFSGVALAVDTLDRLVMLRLPDLTVETPSQLSSKATWGPQRCGALALLATEDNQLLAFDDQGQQRWKIPLPDGPLAGPPLADGEVLLCAVSRGTDGSIVGIAAADGSSVGRVELHRPLASGPALAGDRIVVAGADGCIYSIPRDAMRSAAP